MISYTKDKKIGISLIVLVITIIVIIILAGAVILSLSNNNPIQQANEAVFKENMKSIQSEIQLYLASNVQTDGKFKFPTKGEIKTADSYNQNVLDIIKGKIVYKNPTNSEQNWLKDLAINTDYTQGLVLDMPLGNYVSGSLMGDKTTLANNGANYGTSAVKNRFDSDNKASNFNSGGYVSIPNSSSLNLDSFSISLWGYYKDFTYPKTFGAIKKATTAYINGVGWEFGHGYHSDGIDACLDDGVNIARKDIVFNDGFKPSQLLNKWTHLVYVVDRNAKKVYVYVNGVKQDDYMDISNVTGSLTNTTSVDIGYMYGWITDGYMDDIRIYNRVISSNEVQALYNALWDD